MTQTNSESSPTITTEKTFYLRASETVVEVAAGGWVNFDSGGLPAKLWFPIANQVEQETPVEFSDAPISIQTKAGLKTGTMIPYIFFLTDARSEGVMVEGNSPPYIKIKDPDTPADGHR